MTKRSVHRCANCNHASAVSSNFKQSSDGKAFCNSAKKPACEEARQYASNFNKHMKPKNASYDPISW